MFSFLCKFIQLLFDDISETSGYSLHLGCEHVGQPVDLRAGCVK